MGKCSTTIKTIHFDVTDPELTKAEVTIDYEGDCPMMDRYYTKSFPARIPIVDLFTIKGGITDYLMWPE